jgi:hypothetical protein
MEAISFLLFQNIPLFLIYKNKVFYLNNKHFTDIRKGVYFLRKEFKR